MLSLFPVQIPTPAPVPAPVQATAVAAARPLVMLGGDSVPGYLRFALGRHFNREGWDMVNAAAGGCGMVAVRLVNADGSYLASGEICPDVVRDRQSKALAQDPDAVIWWDRFSISDYLTPSGEHVRAGTTRFWTLRRRQLHAAVQRMTARGAVVVLLATEPPGVGIRSRCTPDQCHPWLRRMITRSDWMRRWNGILLDYARKHPYVTRFRTINATICNDARHPCNDRLPSGAPARPDGTHYGSGGKALAAPAITHRLRSVLR